MQRILNVTQSKWTPDSRGLKPGACLWGQLQGPAWGWPHQGSCERQRQPREPSSSPLTAEAETQCPTLTELRPDTCSCPDSRACGRNRSASHATRCHLQGDSRVHVPGPKSHQLSSGWFPWTLLALPTQGPTDTPTDAAPCWGNGAVHRQVDTTSHRWGRRPRNRPGGRHPPRRGEDRSQAWTGPPPHSRMTLGGEDGRRPL